MKTARLLVHIHFNENMEIQSDHRPLTVNDQATLKSWPSGGLGQTSHALFIEALRKEAYTMAISLLSQGTAEEDLTATAIEERVRTHLLEMTDRFAGGAAQEALKRILP